MALEDDLIKQRDTRNTGDENSSSDGRGQVRHPETDGRLRKNGGRGNQKNKDDGDSNGESGGVQHITRLSIQGITYEGIQSQIAGLTIRVFVNGESQESSELTRQDVDNIIEFFTIFQQDQSEDGNDMQSSNHKNGGQGQVRDPEHDGRLKSNDTQRTNKSSANSVEDVHENKQRSAVAHN